MMKTVMMRKEMMMNEEEEKEFDFVEINLKKTLHHFVGF